MPYILMKRNDIPNSTLQVLDLEPNTSQRNYVLDGPGQTLYVNAVTVRPVVTTQPGGGGTPILTHRASEGLAAWFITNIDNGAGAALTGQQALDNANAVLALYGFGDLASAAGALTVAAINGALVAGTITAMQHMEVMDILAGRRYELPAGVQVDSDGATFDVQPAVGADGGPGFAANTLRDLFANDGLPLSFVEGELAGFRANGFVYNNVGGANGEAVAVYNDDGTLYTP